MKYIENFEDLEVDEYYHCVTYDDEDIVVQYHGYYDGHLFSANLDNTNIRYVLEKVENLRDKRKKFE